ncbi:MAG: choice-of-anchor D domain-containing protein [Terriglobales bacterium]
MNGHWLWLYRRLAACFVIASGLLLLIGCQNLSGGSNGGGSVGVTSGTLNFGTVDVGSSKTLPDALTNNTSSAVTISSIQGLGSGFTLTGITLPLVLAAGQSAPFNVTYAPTTAGDPTTTISFDGPNAQALASLSATATAVTPGTLAANPTSLPFGSVAVGNDSSLSETLTNTGGASVTISTVTSSAAAFTLGPLTLPATLAANKSVTFTVTFTPATTGAASGSLSVVSDASNSPLSIALSGTGTAAAAGTLAVSPTTLSFGSVVDGSSSPLTGKLSATGSAVKVSSASITGTNSGDFVLSGITLPVTIAAGQSSTFTVTFTPGAKGTASASLSFTSNASNSPTVQSLTGTGAPYVALDWNSSEDATGYNVYRGTVNGGPYPTKLTTSPIATTTYNDTTVVSGQNLTYYYVTTAVAGSSESGYSDQASATIQ